MSFFFCYVKYWNFICVKIHTFTVLRASRLKHGSQNQLKKATKIIKMQKPTSMTKVDQKLPAVIMCVLPCMVLHMSYSYVLQIRNSNPQATPTELFPKVFVMNLLIGFCVDIVVQLCHLYPARNHRILHVYIHCFLVYYMNFVTAFIHI